jgi:hypothetical protein
MSVKAGRSHTVHSIYIKHDETPAYRMQPVDEVAPQYVASVNTKLENFLVQWAP